MPENRTRFRWWKYAVVALVFTLAGYAVGSARATAPAVPWSHTLYKPGEAAQLMSDLPPDPPGYVRKIAFLDALNGNLVVEWEPVR